MKVGIITFHSVINYGSAIQAYAMQEGIAKIGIDTEIIDYRGYDVPLGMRIKNNLGNIFNIAKWKRFIGRKINKKIIFENNLDRSTRRKKKFVDFQKEFFRMPSGQISKSGLCCLNEVYDAFICGSDQIWNPTYIGHDMSYFLDFVQPGWKRISYAPSIAVNEFVKEYEKEIAEQLGKFENISVRERNSVDIVKKLTGKNATVVVDPTMLLSAQEWRIIEKCPAEEYVKEPYIFCYFLGANKEYCEYVEYLKSIVGLKIVLVTCTDMKVFSKFGDVICDDIGPSEFLYLIDHASYICTDSFHGTVFSILFQKQFFTFKRYKDKSIVSENSRIYNLLGMIDATNRIINNSSEIECLIEKSIDYNSVGINLQLNISNSEHYLKAEIERVKSRY